MALSVVMRHCVRWYISFAERVNLRLLAFPAASLRQRSAEPLPKTEALPYRISAWVIHWNAPEWCEDTVRSLLASSGVELQVTVLDNACTRPWNPSDSGVGLVHMTRNLGYAGAASWILQNSDLLDVDLVVICSHDVIVAPNALQRLAHASVGIPTPSLLGPETFLSSRNPTAHTGSHMTRRPWLNGSLLAFSPSAVLGLSYFETRFGSYVEDVEICLRAWERGYTVAALEDLEVRCHGSISRRKGYLIGRNTVALVCARRGRLVGLLAVAVQVSLGFIEAAATLSPEFLSSRVRGSIVGWQGSLDQS